ncbi:heat shock protein HslJ [Isoptericola sp. CG 20/1183]|uniref:Heat shock protein HslJ n=1 Tax=Isoptericola halotolerans TaxID=300560 RepID=A0ABX5ECB7_9MICO|nr:MULTISPECIES: META domain-containing protein [Isoptericola]MCK0115454.1 META domain-containing protein [Isoptericola sp. S6320L]PRZ04473.1 heat shock protein HslJ [Isoptericola halotolerans]PRZ04629.1 heat shock protein HslJ [Isoptericola sp. CG 20/1183]
MTARRAPRTLLAALLGTLLAATALAACAGGAGDVAGRTFVVTDVVGRELAGGSPIVLAFTEDSVGAQPGCNSMSAPATWDDGTLRLTGEMRSTLMACSDELMDQETWFSELLRAEPTLALDGETLTLTAPDATVTLVEQT